MLPAINTLKKDTLEATYEHVNRLIKEVSGENYDVKKFIEYNDKSNVFEKKIQVIIIDSLKIKEGVINGLLSNDIHVIKRTLKCNWFFEDAVTPEFYKNSIFPNVSFSTRCKIMNKLSRNIKSEAHAEELFQFIRCNYGNKYAEMFLPKCQAKFISTYITEFKPLFQYNDSIRILINICKRFPTLIVAYLENYLHKDCFHISGNFSKLLCFLAKNFPDHFLSFFVKNHSKLWNFRFGRKLTKSLSAQMKDRFKNSLHKIIRQIFYESAFLKNFSFDELLDFFDSLIRDQGKELTISRWLETLPHMIQLLNFRHPSERATVLETVFTKLYKEKLEDHPELWTRSFLEFLPIDYRIHYVDKLYKMSEDTIMKLKLHEDCEDSEREMHDIFLYLMSSKSAFLKLTALMSKMSNKKRRETLIKEMIKNSLINEDAEGLEAVFDYILQRHKNDNPQMIVQILYYFRYCWHKCHEVSPKMLTSNVWLLIEQMATLVLLNSKECKLYRSLMEEYVRYRLLKNLDIQSQIRNMVKLSFIPFLDVDTYLLVNVKRPFSKEIFSSYYNEIFMILNAELVTQDAKENLLIMLLRTLNKYNAHSKRNRINVKDFPLLINEIDNLLKLPKYNTDVSVLVSELMKNNFLKEKYATRLLQISLLPDTLNYLLRHKPNYVINSLENILNDLFSIYDQVSFKKFLTSRSRLDFLNITSEIEKITSEKFKTSVSSTRKLNALRMYSHFANIEDFAHLVREYVPDRDRMNLDKDNSEFLEIQMIVPQIIKNIKPDSNNFSLILNYLHSDFLRWMLTSWDSACFNSPVKILLQVLKELFPNKSVTVKKIILYKIRDLSFNDEKLNHFKNLWDKEKHSSVRSVIFQVLSKCFSENPTKETFEILKKCILEADELCIKYRPKFSSVPAQFLNEYTILLWKFSERIESYRFVINFKNVLIKNFASQNIWVLSEDFCDMLLKLYLFDDNSKVLVQRFCCYYLISNPYSMNQKLNLILQIMYEKKTNYKSIKFFLEFLRDLSLKDPKRFVGVFEGILGEWPKIYQKTKLFDEYILLQYAKSYNVVLKNFNFDNRNDCISAEFGKELRRIFNEFPNNSCLIEILICKLSHFFRNLNDFNWMIMFNNMLSDSFEPNLAIIVIKAMPYTLRKIFRKVDFNSATKLNEECQVFVNKLKAINDDDIKIYFNYQFETNLEDF